MPLAKQRLDAVLAARADGTFSRMQIKNFILEGRVKVDGCVEKTPSAKVYPDAIIECDFPAPAEELPAAEEIALDIIFEDDSIIVLNKPAGLIVHPGSGHPAGTLVNALLNHFPAIADVGDAYRAGIVHRLDMFTSGLLVVAKTSAAFEVLAAQFKARKVSKHYIAIVRGIPKPREGIIDAPIGRNPRSRRKMMANPPEGGKEARTKYKVRGSWKDSSLVDVFIETGRTHQIRVHMSMIGNPVIGDSLYGGTCEGVERQMLHAAEVEFAHPITGERLHFEAPLPPDFVKMISERNNCDGNFEN